ncbi:MAG TPA: hypothetical protein VH143_33375 [Kofleriaceae bacterium]|jgi:hypothetical protein|nr:hypothetical protein [Kofleriaceae bacterium]
MNRVVVCAVVALAAEAHADPCADALVTLDDGAVVNVEWPVRTATELHGRALSNATLEIEYTLALRADGAVGSASWTTRNSDNKPTPGQLAVPAGAVFWSDRLPCTLEQVVLRARVSHAAQVALVASSKDMPATASVASIDANNWTVTLGPRSYDVVLDDRGCMVAATLASYGITFERRAMPERAVESMYGAPPDAPYTATDVKIAAPAGHVLAGTLTRPKSATTTKRAPAAAMITGISKHERNEGAPPYAPASRARPC